MNKIIKDKKIAMIGGGPGGLSLARLLQMRDAKVEVYERDFSSNARIQGGSLDLHHESGLKVIEEAGLLQEYISVSRPEGGRLKMYDKTGSLILDNFSDSESESKPEIDRRDLRNLLVNYLLPGTILWDHQFITLTKIGKQFELMFKDRPNVIADVVIGSDGARSKVRHYITDISPQYSGTTLIQGEVLQPEISCPEIYNMVNQGSVVVLGDEKALIIQQKGNGNLIFYSTARQPENWINTSGINFNSNQQVIHFLEIFYKGWHSQFIQLFSAAFEFVPRPMYSTPADQTWRTKENVTIIGDAAHVMPPFAGVGVNMAMLDALDLTNCLTDEHYIDVTTAFTVFEKRMLCRSAKMQLMTKDSEDIFHSPTATKDLANRMNSKA